MADRGRNDSFWGKPAGYASLLSSEDSSEEASEDSLEEDSLEEDSLEEDSSS